LNGRVEMRRTPLILVLALTTPISGADLGTLEVASRSVPPYLESDFPQKPPINDAKGANPGGVQASGSVSRLDVSCDMLDWMTLDADLREDFHLTGSHAMSTSVTSDKIYYVKSTTGGPWDIALIADGYIHDWITESYECVRDPLNPSVCAEGSCGVLNPWSDKTAYKKFSYNTNNPIMPLFAQGGYPGTRVVATSGLYQIFRDCGYCRSDDLEGIVHELWGPYQIDMEGDLGEQTILKITYFNRCEDTSDTSSCQFAETNWYSQRYGWVRWTEYVNVNGSFVVSRGPSVFNSIQSGAISPDFPCF
jgi:hypothetical protein